MKICCPKHHLPLDINEECIKILDSSKKLTTGYCSKCRTKYTNIILSQGISVLTINNVRHEFLRELSVAYPIVTNIFNKDEATNSNNSKRATKKNYPNQPTKKPKKKKGSELYYELSAYKWSSPSLRQHSREELEAPDYMKHGALHPYQGGGFSGK